MGVFTHWPYTNIHELNLDFLLQELKKAIDEWIATRSQFGKLETDFADLKEYVNDYFNSLDVTNEVSEKLEQMLADGELDEILKGQLVTWDRLFGAVLRGEAIARERIVLRENPQDPNSRTHTLQNGTIFSPSDNYNNDGSQKYIYYWGGYSDNLNTSLVTYDVVNRAVVNRLEVEDAGHGGELVVKDGKLYCLTAYTPFRKIIFDITSPAHPVLESNEPITLNSHRLAGYDYDMGRWIALSDDANERKIYTLSDNFSDEQYVANLETNMNTIIQDYSYDPNTKMLASLTQEPNAIQFNNLDGSVITTTLIPNDIAYISTGETEWIYLNGANIYVGGMTRQGAGSSETRDIITFHSNAQLKSIYERYISNSTYITPPANVDNTADNLNPIYRGLRGQNIRFRYVEDAVNFLKSFGTGIISIINEYPYSFRIPIDCTLRFNSNRHGAVVIDTGVRCVIQGLGGECIGEPVSIDTTTEAGTTKAIKTFFYFSSGADITMSRVDAQPVNANADIMFYGSSCAINITSRLEIKNMLLESVVLTSQGYIGENMHIRESMLYVKGVNANYGNSQYVDMRSTILGYAYLDNVAENYVNRITNLKDKYFPRPILIYPSGTSGGLGRPTSPIGLYGNSVSTSTVYWGYWNGDTYNAFNWTATHDTALSPVAEFNGHRWSFTTDQAIPNAANILSVARF